MIWIIVFIIHLSQGFLHELGKSFKFSSFHHHETKKFESTPFLLRMSYSSVSINMTNPPQQHKQYVINPETNRRIQITHRKSSKWFQFMFKKGGYIAYRNKLASIDCGALLKFNEQRKNQQSIDQKETDRNACNEKTKEAYISYSDNKCADSADSGEVWFVVNPVIISNNKPIQSLSSTYLQQLKNLLFVHKPPDLLTVPGKVESNCLTNQIITSICSPSLSSDNHIFNEIQPPSTSTSKQKKSFKTKQNQSKIKATFTFPKPCHRLDRDTSGIIVYGLTHESHRDVSIQFQNRATTKQYVALVAGIVESDTGTINLRIGKELSQSKTYQQWAVEMNHSNSNSNSNSSMTTITKPRDAITTWMVSKRFPTLGYTRIILYPHTGRGHQLRLHMKAIGHPILGDTLHAPSLVANATPRLCLHAEQLEVDLNSEIRLRAISLPPY